MAEHAVAADNAAGNDHPHPNYMMVFWWLLGMTILEVAITYTSLGEVLIVVVLLSLAFIKAGLVALYFMHLRYDHKVLSVIAVVPLILVAIAVCILSYEYTHYTISDSAKTVPVLAEPHH